MDFKNKIKETIEEAKTITEEKLTEVTGGMKVNFTEQDEISPDTEKNID